MKILKHTIAVAALILCASISAYADGVTQSVKGGARNLQTTFFDIIDKDVTTISFDQGKSDITESEKATLTSVFNAVRNDSKIKKAVIAAWSDQELPREGRILSGTDEKLAEKRAKKVRDILNNLGVSNTSEYTMAKRANWFENVFNLSDSQVKKAMVDKKVSDKKYKKIASVLQKHGGPSKAVVIFIRESSTDISH